MALGVVYNCSFRQCFINTLTPIGKDNYCNDILVTNCYINYLKSNNGIESMWFSTESTIAINNSILKSLAYKNSEGLFPFYFSNNISYVNLPSTANLINNVFVGSGTPIQDVNGNWTGVPNAALWAAEGEDGSYSEKKDFALKYPERYVGNDGTEIGLHGGVYAWNKIPCIPRITECTIDTENASNGTIKVSIKAEAQTKE